MTGNLISKVRYFTFPSRWQSWTSFLLVSLIDILNHSVNLSLVMYVNVFSQYKLDQIIIVTFHLP